MKAKVDMKGALATYREEFKAHAGFDSRMLPRSCGGDSDSADAEIAQCAKVPVGTGELAEQSEARFAAAEQKEAAGAADAAALGVMGVDAAPAAGAADDADAAALKAMGVQ